MIERNRRTAGKIRALFCLCAAFAVAVILLVSVSPRSAVPQGTPLQVFSAPSHTPPGENWVLVGSLEDLPEDLGVSPLQEGVSVLEVQTLSRRALAVRIQAPAGLQGNLLRVSSLSGGSSADLNLKLGQAVPSLSADANIKSEDFTDGVLLVPGVDFVYGYLEATDAGLAALRIHNRATGVWHSHEHAREKTKEVPAPPALDPNVFGEVDRTLVDSDGDEVPDSVEAEENPPEPTAKQLGVALVMGLNWLDLVAVDEAGNASWRLIRVQSTGGGGQGGF